MQETLQQENGNLAPSRFPAAFPLEARLATGFFHIGI
jgi:hypothetical protein